MRTLLEALRDSARHTNKGITFVRSDGKENALSYREVWAETRRRAVWFSEHGIRKGDRVVLTLPEADDFVLCFFGVMAAGAVPVPLYPPLTLARLEAYVSNVCRVIQKCGAKLLVTSHGRLFLGDESHGADLPSGVSVVAPEALRNARDVELAVDVAPDDLAFLQFTSGSTSQPKGVMVSHGALAANAHAIMFDGLAADPSTDRGVSWLPLYHDMGLIGFVIAPIFAEVPVVLLPTTSFIRRPSSWLEAIHRHRGTITFAPNFAFALCVQGITPKQMQDWDLSSLRAVGCGAEPIDGKTLRAFLDKFGAVGLRAEAMLPAYGLAESTLAVTFSELEQPLISDRIDPHELVRGRALPAANGHAVEIVSCGKAFPHHRVQVVDDHGQQLPERQVGEIVVEGPSLASGYFGEESASRGAFRGGRLFTGDLGYMASGRLFVCGRKKDLIILRGRNYFPQDLEKIISEVEGIRAAQVAVFTRGRGNGAAEVGLGDELLVAVAEVQSSQLEAEPLRRAVVAAVFEQTGLRVDEVHFLRRGELPKTSSGKVRRGETRARLLAGTLARTAMACAEGAVQPPKPMAGFNESEE
jgi:fatty-acyl-CoA synthase